MPCWPRPGIERVGQQHGVVERRQVDAVPGSTRQSYLRFCPILRTEGSSSSGFSTASASLIGTCLGLPSPKSKLPLRRRDAPSGT